MFTNVLNKTNRAVTKMVRLIPTIALLWVLYHAVCYTGTSLYLLASYVFLNIFVVFTMLAGLFAVSIYSEYF